MPNIITLLFVPWGKVARGHYFLGQVINWLLNIILTSAIANLMGNTDEVIMGILISIARLLTTYICVNLMIKRFHDLGEHPAKVLYILIPFVNIYFFFKLLLEKGADQTMTVTQAPTIGTSLSSDTPTTKSSIPVRGWIMIAILWMVAVWGGIFLTVINMVKSSEAYQLSLNELENNPAITAIYGNFTVWFMPMGSIQTSWPDGEASLQIELDGEKVNGNVYIYMTKEYGTWNMIEMVSVDEHNNQQYIIGGDEKSTMSDK